MWGLECCFSTSARFTWQMWIFTETNHVEQRYENMSWDVMSSFSIFVYFGQDVTSHIINLCFCVKKSFSFKKNCESELYSSKDMMLPLSMDV